MVTNRGTIIKKKKQQHTETIDFDSENEVIAVLGIGDKNLRIIEEMADVQIIPRGTSLKIIGSREEIDIIIELFKKLRKLAQRGLPVDSDEVTFMLQSLKEGDQKTEPDEEPMIDRPEPDYILASKLRIFPRSEGQKSYIRSMRENAITFCIGPAGTGKTYLAVAMAISYLSDRKSQRIILTRPAVEAGESLGFLPGDLYEKVEPYFRPLYDALFEMLGVERARKLIDHEVIEIAPLAYMRGRTLNRSFIILDEAQNTTNKQMKMFLTRMGPSSRMVVTGDPTQVDLPGDQQSGLISSWEILQSIEGIGFNELKEGDIVRHSLVHKIVEAYDKSEKKIRDADKRR
jgi:phosphate starvation-inducible protein PhoH and related proteins